MYSLDAIRRLNEPKLVCRPHTLIQVSGYEPRWEIASYPWFERGREWVLIRIRGKPASTQRTTTRLKLMDGDCGCPRRVKKDGRPGTLLRFPPPGQGGLPGSLAPLGGGESSGSGLSPLPPPGTDNL